MPKQTRTKSPKSIESLTHEEARRTNLPSAEHQSLMRDEEQKPFRLAYERRNRDLDPQLVWRGKDQQDQSDLVVNVPPLYIQERIHPKALIDDLVATSRRSPSGGGGGGWPQATDHRQLDLFADFNGLPSEDARTEFYRHDANWSNRMVLGDSLQVMASLAEREGLRGKVQCIYLDPPYGIKFNSNFQWSTTSRDVKDGNAAHITREPEQVKAFRDTWRDGIHSYLSYLRDRLTVARDLLSESGSIFVQIGDENVHRVRALMDEVFGDDNSVSLISYPTSIGLGARNLDNVNNYLLWYSKDKENLKFRPLFHLLVRGGMGATRYTKIKKIDGVVYNASDLTDVETERLLDDGAKYFTDQGLTSRTGSATTGFAVDFQGKRYRPSVGGWRTSELGMLRVKRAARILKTQSLLRFQKNFDDFSAIALTNNWYDVSGGVQSRNDPKVYAVQTATNIVERCILMTTDPGDLVLDPTCGSGTAAYVAEQWGRRWITIDTSRVALALARARVMGARYPYYLLSDSPEGQRKEAEITGRHSSLTTDHPPLTPTYGNVRQGFVYQRVPHITLRAIANNSEIDVIWEQYEKHLAPLRQQITAVISDQWPVASGQQGTDELTTDHRPPTTDHRPLVTDHSPLEEWDIPRQRPDHWPPATEPLITEFWTARVARQREIDASISRNADYEYLYDKPYEDRGRVRVAGPFTVESVSPHRVLAVDENGEFVDGIAESKDGYGGSIDFAEVILENLRTSGVQQAHKEDRITFTSLTPWPGHLVCAEGRFASGQWPVTSDQSTAPSLTTEPRAAIFIGPEFGTVSRPDLVEAAREAAEGGFDVLIACAFNYEAHTTEFESLGRVPVLKARMNADLHMAGDLKNTGKGNLFVIFGEPDVTVNSGQWLVARDGSKVANYDDVKELSGLGSLEEINRAGRDGLSNLCAIPAGGEIRLDQPGPAGGSVGAGEYSGGSGTSRNRGVSPVLGDSQRLVGRDGDDSHSGAATGTDHIRTVQASDVAGIRSWTDAQRTQTLAAIQALRDPDFPLSLTTDHWSQVTVHGVDVFHPSTGEVRSDGPEGIACWFIDTDYNQESFFVRHAYFLGAGDPYKSLKITLKAEINQEAWASLNSDTSRPFEKPSTGRIAVKVINHLGDEVMKVFRV